MTGRFKTDSIPTDKENCSPGSLGWGCACPTGKDIPTDETVFNQTGEPSGKGLTVIPHKVVPYTPEGKRMLD